MLESIVLFITFIVQLVILGAGAAVILGVPVMLLYNKLTNKK